jgi:UDP-glucose:(heptosyl)LPS alpha-1,3-glucosyltransferase
MRLAIVRQDYHPDGAVERATEQALEALLERNVAVSLYTRSWPQTRLQLIEPVICDPFHIGKLWRDWSFANAACRSIRRTLPSLVEAHEPMLCCDVYRAGGGVHASDWRSGRGTRRRPGACGSRAPRTTGTWCGSKSVLFASPWLRTVICKSTMVRDEIRARFAVPESKLAVIYNPVDAERFHPGCAPTGARSSSVTASRRAHDLPRSLPRFRARLRRHGDRCDCALPPPRISS